MKKYFRYRSYIAPYTRTYVVKPQDIYLPLPSDKKISVKHTALKISVLLIVFSIVISLLTTMYAPRLIHQIPSSITPTINFAIQKPAHEGKITIGKTDNTPTTIIMAGDSLARGHGSQEVNGQLKTIGYYLAQKANQISPGIAHYQVIDGLSVDWSSVSMTDDQIHAHMEALSKIPNLVLMLSFTNRDMQNFVMDAAKVHSSNRLGEFFQIAQTLNHDSKTYQQSLTGLRGTLAKLQEKRQKELGDKKAVMQAVILGLPNESYSPSVKDVLGQYRISYSQFAYVINLFNTNDREAAILGNKENNGITYSFINLDRLRVSEHIALESLSSDRFHPNDKGYALLAHFVSRNVVISGAGNPADLADK